MDGEAVVRNPTGPVPARPRECWPEPWARAARADAKEAKEAGDDWVYDVYVMDDDDNVEDDDEGDETTPVIRVKDLSDAFDWEENVESDYGDSDSNAEDYFENDYPDTEETESERGWSDDSFDSDDGERRMDDYH